MKSVLIALLLVLPTTSFAMSGTLEGKAGSLRVEREDGMKVGFYAGKYRSELGFENGKANFMVERKDVRTDAVIKFPAGTQIPENGAIDIDGFRTGQTFAIKGTISTVKAETAPVKDNESCVYYREEWVCHGWGPNYHCDWQTRPVHGIRPVEYYFETKTVTLALVLDSRNGGDVAWNGKDVERRKIYTFQGNCY